MLRLNGKKKYFCRILFLLGCAAALLAGCSIGLSEKNRDPSLSKSRPWFDYWYYVTCLSVDSSYKVLEVDNRGVGEVKNGSKVQVWEFRGGQNQLWKFIPTENGYYYIINSVNPRLSLDADIAPGIVGNGTKVQLWEYCGSDNQLWQMQIENTWQCIIRSKANPDLAIDADILPGGGRLLDGSKVQLWTYAGTGNQKWGLNREN
jgi:hypothetical protein